MGFLNKLSNLFSKKEGEVTFRVVYEDDFISLTPSIDLKNNRQILDLINMYNIDMRENQLFLNYKEIYELYYDENDNPLDVYKSFGLPSLFKGFIRIENINNFIQDKKILYSFELEGYEGKYDFLKGNVIHCFISGDLKILPPKVYELLKMLREYNLNEEQNQNVAHQFDTLRIIKDYAEEVNILLNQRLRDEEKPVVIDKIKVDFIDDGEILNVLPIFSENDNTNNELLTKLSQYDGIRDFYSANVNGKKIKFVMKNKESLNTVLQNKELRGAERLKVLKGASPLFQDDNIDLSEYGPRVIGIGYLSYRSYPAMGKSNGLLWREEVGDAPHFYAGSEKITLEPNQLPKLQAKLSEMNKRNEEMVEMAFKTEEGETAKVILSEEQLKNEIIKLQHSIISPTEINSKSMLKEILEQYDQVPENHLHIPYKGKYIEKYDKKYFEEKLEELERKEKKAGRKGETLLTFENLEEEEYKENTSLANLFLQEAEDTSLLKPNISLFDYQKEALHKLQNLYLTSKRNGFLLCDDMGLGKTLQLLAFLGWLKDRGELTPALVVAPTSLLNNWDNEDGSGEIQKFFKEGSFKTMKIRGSVRDIHLDKIREHDIVFTTYETLRINNIALGKIHWSAMICDEAQKIKNPQTLVTVAAKAQNANFKIVCSATPIENSLIDLWNLVDYSKPGVLGSLKNFKQNYLNKLKNQDEENLEDINDELHNKISQYYIRREKSILSKKLPPKRIKIYKAKANQYEIETIDQLIRSESNTLALIQKMLIASNHVDLLMADDLDVVDVTKLINRSSKLQILEKILKEIPKKDEKVIIFSRSIKVQRLLYRCIDHWFNLKSRIVNGKITNLDKRSQYLDEFRHSKGFDVIILSPDVAGFGLTLTEANHVIHFTRLWNPAKEDQATDRAYRIGQDKEVSVYYLMLTLGESMVEIYDSAEDYVKEYNEVKKTGLSPEEKLNILLARKKNMLLKFFLAVGDGDINQKDFLVFDEGKSQQINKNMISMKDLENGVIDAFEFESLIAIIFERKGYTTFLTTRSNDYGVDVVCMKGEEITLIQCKKVQKLNAIDTIKDLLYARDIYSRNIPDFTYKLLVVTNADEIPATMENYEEIKVLDYGVLNKELNKHEIYKAQVDIKNNNRYSFENIKIKISNRN